MNLQLVDRSDGSVQGNLRALIIVRTDDPSDPVPSDRINIDAAPLVEALVEMQRAWRAGKTTYDVRTMTAFGAVIRETEAIIATIEGGNDGRS